MSVIPITIFFSLLLAGIFVLLFVREQRRRFGSAERDSLLPLADETPHEVARDIRAPAERVRPPRSTPDHDHDHADGQCGCRDGQRPPCVGCQKPLGRPASSTPLS